jgi:ankyrin repeat protein
MRSLLGILAATWIIFAGADSLAESCALAYMPMPEVHKAASSGEVTRVTLLLSANPELARTSNLAHGTPLHVAARNGHDAVVVVLIARGADVNARNWSGATPIDFAIMNGHDKVVTTLIANGATNRPLHMACALGNTNIVELLLANKADPNARDTSDHNLVPMHCAARNGHVGVVQILLNRKMDVSVSDKYGNTPLHYAAGQGQLEMVKFLIANGAQVNATTRFKDTPLHAACTRYKPVVEVLVAAGADINAKNKDGFTPLKAAKTWGTTDMVDLLREHGGVE